MFPYLSSHFASKPAKTRQQTSGPGNRATASGPLLLELLYNNSPALMDTLEVGAKSRTNDLPSPILLASPRRDSQTRRKTIDPECVNEDGDTVLIHTANYGDYPKATRKLLKAGANLDRRDEKGRDALILNTLNRHHNAVKEILDFKAQPNPYNILEDIRLLYGEEPLLEPLVLSQDAQGDTALTHAVRNNNNDAVYLFTQAQVKPNTRNKKGDSAIIEAAKQGNGYALIRLLKNNADPNARDKDGKTVLMHWLSAMKPDTQWESVNYQIGDMLLGLHVGFRLHRYIRPEKLLRPSMELWSRMIATQELYGRLSDEDMRAQDNEGKSALSYLAASPLCHMVFGNLILAKALDHQVSIDQPDHHGITPVMRWALNKPKNRIDKMFCDTESFYVRFSTHINQQDDQGKTALIHAAECGNYQAIYAITHKKPGLVNTARADVNIQDAQGQTAFMKLASLSLPRLEAPREEQRPILTRIMLPKRPEPQEPICYDDVRYVMRRGLEDTDLTLKDTAGNTVLMLAARSGNIPVLEQLSRFRDLARQKNRAGQTALQIAKENNDAEAIGILQKME